MGRSGNPEEFLTPAEKESVETAIKAAESRTTAEIKLVIVRHCWVPLLDKAQKIFLKNNLHKTEQRNCVMIMLVLANREFLIYGDKGINDKVGENFWVDVKDSMAGYFRHDEFGNGLAEAITQVGEKLAEFFPYREDDRNEISNAVAYED